jgi:hypothetical protein
MWAKNCWYVIAWEHEIPAADSPKLFTRTLLNEPVLVYRTALVGRATRRRQQFAVAITASNLTRKEYCDK